MKIRYGFVSNSSTTSFTIYGLEAKTDNLKIPIVENSGKRSNLAAHIRQIIKDKNLNLQLQYGQSSELYVGMNYDDMFDNETKSQFYARVILELAVIFNEVMPQWYEDSWYDG